VLGFLRRRRKRQRRRRRPRSDGSYHERNAVLVLLMLCGISGGLLICGHPALGFGLVLGGLFGLFNDPDLDHRDTTRAENRVRRLFGRVPDALFRLYWTPYTLFGHRSFFTHGGYGVSGMLAMVLVATPIRILYAFWWFILPSIFYAPIHKYVVQVPVSFWLVIYLGWAIQDAVHRLRDNKRRQR